MTLEEAINEIERLRDGYRKLANASDLEMRDGDLAREIANSMLQSCHEALIDPVDDKYLTWPGKDKGKPKPPIIWLDDK